MASRIGETTPSGSRFKNSGPMRISTIRNIAFSARF
jgi:hypothetical protein